MAAYNVRSWFAVALNLLASFQTGLLADCSVSSSGWQYYLRLHSE